MNFPYGHGTSREPRRQIIAPPGRTYHTGNPFARVLPSQRRRPIAEVTSLARHTDASRPPERQSRQTLSADQQTLPPRNVYRPEPSETSKQWRIDRDPNMPEYCDLTGDITEWRPVSTEQARQLIGLPPRHRSHVDLSEDDEAGVAIDSTSASSGALTARSPTAQVPHLYEAPSPSTMDATPLSRTIDQMTGSYQTFAPLLHCSTRPQPAFRDVEWRLSPTNSPRAHAEDGLYSPRWTPPSPQRRDVKLQAAGLFADRYTNICRPSEQPQSYTQLDMAAHGNFWPQIDDRDGIRRNAQALKNPQSPVPQPPIMLRLNAQGLETPLCPIFGPASPGNGEPCLLSGPATPVVGPNQSRLQPMAYPVPPCEGPGPLMHGSQHTSPATRSTNDNLSERVVDILDWDNILSPVSMSNTVNISAPAALTQRDRRVINGRISKAASRRAAAQENGVQRRAIAQQDGSRKIVDELAHSEVQSEREDDL